MTAFLMFTLYAPWASWGDIAVGERRSSWDRPSRSAILGLIGAALGIGREAQAQHDAVDQGYGVAVRVDDPGRPAQDYHTTQTVAESAVRKHRPNTRRELLLAGEPETILSYRSYRVDAHYTIALWTRAAAPHPLTSLAEALRKPGFVLYAGRKANPLALPLAPYMLEAESIADAFRSTSVDPHGLLALNTRKGRADPAVEVSFDPDPHVRSGFNEVRRHVRRDAQPHRGRWQFAERIVETGFLRLETSAP
jgi:CRISPR system Cascade subunit CasD